MKRYYLSLGYKRDGDENSLLVTSDNLGSVKRMWRAMLKRYSNNAVLSYSKTKFVVKCGDKVRQCAYGEYTFSGEDPYKDSTTI